MIYLEDIIELIEDVPDELQRRGGLIQDWERQASEYKKEADKLTARLNNEVHLRDDEKANLFRQIAEMLKLARDVTQKKSDMAEKCHRLVQALSEKVSEYSFNCKLELEVDAPGCTASIERSFVQETMMMAAAAVNSRSGLGPEFRVPEERQQQQQNVMRDRMASSSISRESTPYGGGGRGVTREYGRTRDNSINSSRASSTQPFDLHQPTAAAMQQQQRKRKRDRERERQRERQLQQYEPTPSGQLQQQRELQLQQPALKESQTTSSSTTKMSSYMRKKKEREREQRKLREVHANRERTSQQRAIKPEPYDDGYETRPTPTPPPQQLQPVRPRVGRPPGRMTTNNPLHHTLPVRREEQPERRDEPEDTFAGGMSDADADDDDLLSFLNSEMPGGIGGHDDLNLGLEDENLFDMVSFGADLGKALEKIQKERPPSPLGHNIYGTLNAPTKASAAGPSRYTNKSSSKADKKRQQTQPRPQYVSFGAGESMHGRQRRMTPRADIFSHDLETREKKRRQKEEDVAHGEYSGYMRESRDVSLVDDTYGAVGQEDDSDNTPYCYCHRPSEGVMVGCEGRNCQYGGWFHLACLDMVAPPAVEKWYCNDCKFSRGSGSSLLQPGSRFYGPS